MPAGKYRHRVTIEQIQAAPPLTAAGEVDLSDDAAWETFAVRWAQIAPAGGSEQFRGRQLQADVESLVTLRHDAQTAAITPRMRLRWDGRTFGIARALDVDARHVAVELHCTERV